MSLSLLDEVHYQGQKRAILGEIEELKRRVESLELSAALGLFLAGTTTLVAPGAILAAGTEIIAPEGVTFFRAYGTSGGFMVWEGASIGATAMVAIALGPEAVTEQFYIIYIVTEITGGVSTTGVAVVAPGGAAILYNDGVDVLQAQVSAAGMVTFQRTAGTDTFKVLAIMLWQ